MNTTLLHVRKSVLLLWLGLVLGAGVVVGAVAGGPRRKIPVFLSPSTDAPSAAGISFEQGFAAVVRKALPAVVNISSSKTVHENGPSPFSLFFNDPLFRQFFGPQFGRQYPRSMREESLGSGVVLNPDGYILTNNHVIAGASQIKVFLPDRREFKGRLIGTDTKTDVAVLKIDAQNLPTLPLGDSSKIEVGNFALAIGDPFGIGETVTAGIISAKGRSGLDIEDYEDFIQTDAAINPGNSGGALIDAEGRLIGINTAIVSGGGHGNQGIGFAIPINMARGVMEQILKHGKVIRGYLGVGIQEVTPEIAKAFGLAKPEGALVNQVESGSPAEEAGLKKGDVITAIDGQPVVEENDLRLAVAQAAPGARVHLKVMRNGHEMDLTATLAELPEKAGSKAKPNSGTGSPLSGIEVQDLTPDIAQQLGVPAGTRGVVISEVAPGSAGEAAGLKRGDVIEEIDHKPVDSVGQFDQAVRRSGSERVLLLIERGGATAYVVIGQ
jgi:serine protease Do